MADDRSLKLYDAWRQGSEKFDYFVVGAAGALCAFVAQNLPSERLALSPTALELVALGFLVISVIFGFKRLEWRNAGSLANHSALHYAELATAKGEAVAQGHSAFFSSDIGSVVTAEQALEVAAAQSKTSERFASRARKAAARAAAYYTLRNWTLLTGFLLLVAARVWRPYYSIAAPLGAA